MIEVNSDWADIVSAEEGVYLHCIDGESVNMASVPFAVYTAICRDGVWIDMFGDVKHPSFWYTKGNYFEAMSS
jgi:hypothetical protein